MFFPPAGHSWLNPIRFWLKQHFGSSGRKRKALPHAFAPCLETLEERITPATYDWIGNTANPGNNWNDANSWVPHQVPGSSDTAQIGANLTGRVTVNVTDGEAAAILNISNNCTLSVNSGGTFTLAGNTNSSIVGTIDNSGIFNQSQSGANTNITLGNGTSIGSIINESTGTWDIKVSDNPNVTAAVSGSSITNYGIFEDSAPPPTVLGTTTINAPFNNENGTIEADAPASYIDFGGGGQWGGGTFNPGTGASIHFNGAPTTFLDTYKSTETSMEAGTVEFDGDVTIGNLLLGGGATFNLPSGMLKWVSGNIDATEGINDPTGGLINAGDMTFAPGGNKVDVSLFGTLVNKGTFTQSAPGAILLGRLTPGIINNFGTWDIASGNSDNMSDNTLPPKGSAFNNEKGATFQDSDGADQAVVYVEFNNSGTVNMPGSIPGGTPNILTINGTYMQTSDGTLNIGIGATTPDGTLNIGTGGPKQFDLLNVNSVKDFDYGPLRPSGSVNLDGTLNVNLINGFTPSVGNNFQVLKYSSRTGTFNPTIAGSGQFLTAFYDPKASTTPPPPQPAFPNSVVLRDMLQALAVTPATPSVPAGETQQFTATATFTDGSTQDVTSQVTWQSATPSIATIASNGAPTPGLATAEKMGTSSISATLNGIAAAPATLTVTAAALQSIVVTPANPTITIGQTEQFTATEIAPSATARLQT
jgi:hypothetical protein